MSVTSTHNDIHQQRISISHLRLTAQTVIVCFTNNMLLVQISKQLAACVHDFNHLTFDSSQPFPGLIAKWQISYVTVKTMQIMYSANNQQHYMSIQYKLAYKSIIIFVTTNQKLFQKNQIRYDSETNSIILSMKNVEAGQ